MKINIWIEMSYKYNTTGMKKDLRKSKRVIFILITCGNGFTCLFGLLM